MRPIYGPLIDQLPDRLPDAGTGPGWLAELRRQASATLRETGFPHRKVEAWRFTPVKPVVQIPFEPAPQTFEAAAEVAALVREAVGDDDSLQLLMVNGRPQAFTGAEGVEVLGLAQLVAEQPGQLEDLLGKLARAEHFGALNAAMFDDGLVIRVEAGARLERPLHLIHVSWAGAGPVVCNPRVVVTMGPESEATLIESYLARGDAKSLTNGVTEVWLEPAARLEHVRVTAGIPSSYHVAQLAVHADRDSRYASRVVTLGGALSRLELDVQLAAEGAECQLDGVYHAAGTDHIDHQLRIDHAASACSSNVVYRGIVDGASHAVWNAETRVRKGTTRTSAHQENRNLLLSDRAAVNTKPHLEIDADDLVASHGATIGALDEDQLFYLRARGIGESQARAALTYGFAQSIIDEIGHQPSATRLGAALRSRLPDGDSIAELLR